MYSKQIANFNLDNKHYEEQNIRKPESITQLANMLVHELKEKYTQSEMTNFYNNVHTMVFHPRDLIARGREMEMRITEKVRERIYLILEDVEKSK